MKNVCECIDMKLNTKSKSVITAIVALLLVELWRDWPWLKKVFLKANGNKGNFFAED